MATASIEVALTLEEVGRLKTLSLQPGDVLVVESPICLSSSACARIEEHIGRAFPGHQCLVLSEGLTLKVARSADTPHRADTADPDGYGHAV